MLYRNTRSKYYAYNNYIYTYSIFTLCIEFNVVHMRTKLCQVARTVGYVEQVCSNICLHQPLNELSVLPFHLR